MRKIGWKEEYGRKKRMKQKEEVIQRRRMNEWIFG